MTLIITLNQQPCIEHDRHSISIGDTDHEQEKDGYVEKLKEMKRQREDPMSHCEDDTDIEDLYAQEDDGKDLAVAEVVALSSMTSIYLDQ
uniref:Uncharacterized protein n=1 Tax=Oryza brachyantha TaxID=4533 RepID=J3MFF1_ORYBR